MKNTYRKMFGFAMAMMMGISVLAGCGKADTETTMAETDAVVETTAAVETDTETVVETEAEVSADWQHAEETENGMKFLVERVGLTGTPNLTGKVISDQYTGILAFSAPYANEEEMLSDLHVDQVEGLYYVTVEWDSAYDFQLASNSGLYAAIPDEMYVTCTEMAPVFDAEEIIAEIDAYKEANSTYDADLETIRNSEATDWTERLNPVVNNTVTWTEDQAKDFCADAYNELVNHDETFAGGDINFTSAIDYLGFDSAWYYDAASTTE